MVTKFIRARKTEDKQERRSAILKSALVLFETKELAEVKMADIAELAKLAKGTLFLYFPTKEKLFLDLLSELVAEWFQELGTNLNNMRAEDSDLTDRVCHSLKDRPVLRRLLPMLTNVIELNVSDEEILSFKRRLLNSLHFLGSIIETKIPELEKGEGSQVLMRMYAIIIGLQQVSFTHPKLQKLMDLPEVQALKIDFDTELKKTLDAFLKGTRLTR